MDAHRSISLAGSTLTGPHHVCAFFRDKDEMFRVLLPFIVEGLEQREQAIHLMDADNIDLYLGYLAAGGVDVDAAVASGQLQLVEWDQSYLYHGRFIETSALRIAHDALTKAHEQGYPRARLIGDMDWALEDWVVTESFLSFEVHANDLMNHHSNDVAICTYDLSRFGGAVVLDVMRTHPMAIIGGVLQHNPFYVEPQEMLRELRTRGKR